MKPPLQALLITPDHRMRCRILWGEKTITIREGHRDYRLGPCLIACQVVPWAVMVNIVDVRHCVLSDVTEEEYQDDGFACAEDLLEGMRKFYPHIAPESFVTVIRWEDAQGWLVDNADEYAFAPEQLYAKIRHRGK